MTYVFDENKVKLLKDANSRIQICEENDTELKRNLIFIYCPPKVGSTTLVSSFRLSCLNKCKVIHVHDDKMLKVLCGIENVTINEIINYNSQIGKNVYVIDIYRSPIEHKISCFFENISYYHFNNKDEEVNKYDVNKVINRFNKLFPYLYSYDYYKEVYNIPYPESFDFSKKYINQNINGIKYIKLRLFDSQMWGTLLRDITGFNIKIIDDYKTENKPIRDLYLNFKNNYKIPLNLLHIIENCKGLNYYYSEDEKNEYLNNWKSKICDEFIPYNTNEYKIYTEISLENQFYNEIQRSHYIDGGCSCNACTRKRRSLLNKALNGESIEEKIDHNKSNIEFINQKIIVRKAILNKVFEQINISSKQGNLIKKNMHRMIKP